jgi:hypothetical protein
MGIRNKFSRSLILLLVGAVAIALAATLLWRAKRSDGTTGDFI